MGDEEKNMVLATFIRNQHMYFQDPSMHSSKDLLSCKKWEGQTAGEMERQADGRQAESNMPSKLFQSRGHNQYSRCQISIQGYSFSLQYIYIYIYFLNLPLTG